MCVHGITTNEDTNSGTSISLLALTSSAALAGGLDRSAHPTSLIFKKGNMIELCISHAKQSVSGTDISFALAGVTGNATSNTANSFNLPSAGSRFELNESYQQAC